MTLRAPSGEKRITIWRPHRGQIRAHNALWQSRFAILRAGRRFGKTEYARSWIATGLAKGEIVAWFAPFHATWSEVYTELAVLLRPMVVESSRSRGIIRLSNGGRIDFFSLGKANAPRGKGYHRVVVDEAAFAKNGDVHAGDSMMAIWQRVIKPMLVDRTGRALIASNTAGNDPENFFVNICNDPQFAFAQFHATTMDNPILPLREPGERWEVWLERRRAMHAELVAHHHPLVYKQEYLAEFVDWSGVAFFDRDKLLIDGLPAPPPSSCECVFAIIDTAVKTGAENDGTAVVYFAYCPRLGVPLTILDWHITQIEGSLLDTWLPSISAQLEEFARGCRARGGSIGAFIEDTGSGTVLLQHARRKGLIAQSIKSDLTAKGKDERAISVSSYVHRGLVKYSEKAFNKTVVYKTNSRNHLLDQVDRFRVGDKNAMREDDLLDCFCYGIALSLGNDKGF